jgi:hypothetical protein
MNRAQALAAKAALMVFWLVFDWLLHMKDAVPRWYFLMCCALVPIVSLAPLLAAPHA